MHKLLLTLITTTLILSSCDLIESPKRIVYDNAIADTLTIADALNDSTKVLVAGLPVHIDSTDVLMHPIGWESIFIIGGKKINFDTSKSAGSDYRYNERFWISSFDKNKVSGNLSNIVFENIKTGDKRKLTDKIINIRDVVYLKDVAKKIDKHYLIYTVHDNDYNGDGRIDGSDLSARYISYIEGQQFTKITQDYHFFEESTLILASSKLYFRTLEDVNKDGRFDKADKYHYYYIDLNENAFSPIEYFPLDLIKH